MDAALEEESVPVIQNGITNITGNIVNVLFEIFIHYERVLRLPIIVCELFKTFFEIYHTNFAFFYKNNKF